MSLGQDRGGSIDIRGRAFLVDGANLVTGKRAPSWLLKFNGWNLEDIAEAAVARGAVEQKGLWDWVRVDARFGRASRKPESTAGIMITRSDEAVAATVALPETSRGGFYRRSPRRMLAIRRRYVKTALRFGYTHRQAMAAWKDVKQMAELQILQKRDEAGI